MNYSILDFKTSFPEILKNEAEKILKTNIKVGRQFQSSDSFAYLLEAKSEKYVGKIFRFENHPPKGFIEEIQQIFKNGNLHQEEILFVSYRHSVFKFGWILSKYISGELARDLRKEGRLDTQEYFIKLGRLLHSIHKVKFNYFGSIHCTKKRFRTFSERIQDELAELSFENLSDRHPREHEIINKAKKTILSSVNNFNWDQAVLVHDDANDSNVIMHDSNPILIDWIDSFAGPPIRDFAAVTFRQDEPIVQFIEKGYGRAIDEDELRLHQMLRFIRLGRFFYVEDGDIHELKRMMERLANLLRRNRPYGV